MRLPKDGRYCQAGWDWIPEERAARRPGCDRLRRRAISCSLRQTAGGKPSVAGGLGVTRVGAVNDGRRLVNESCVANIGQTKVGWATGVLSGGAPVAAFVAGSLSVRHPINGDARYSEVRPDRLADGLGIRRLKVSSGIDSKADAAYAQDPSCAIESTWKSGTVVLPPACVS